MLKVKKKCCGKCLFGKNKLVSDTRKESILQDCTKNDDHFLCHEGTLNGDKIVCAGFFKTSSSQMIRMAGRLKMIKFID